MLRAGWPRRRHGAGCPVCWGTEGGPAGGQQGAGRVDGEQGRQPRRGSCRAPSARPSPPSLPPCLPSGARSALGVHLCTPALSPTGTRRAWQPRAHTWEVRSRCQCVSHGRPGEEGMRCRAGTAAPGPGTGASAAVGGAPRRRGAGSSHERGLPAACLSTPPSAHPRSGGSDGGRWLELLPEHGRSACREPGHLRAGDTSTPGAPAVAVTHEGRRRCPRPGHLPMGRASPRRQHGARAPQPRPSQAHTLCPRQGPGLLGDGVGSRTSSACRWGQFLFVTVTESRWAKRTLSSPLQ